MTNDKDNTPEPPVIDENIAKLKLEKTRLKTAFTRARKAIVQRIKTGAESVEIDNLDPVLESVTVCLSELAQLYKDSKKTILFEKTIEELETIEAEYSETINLYAQIQKPVVPKKDGPTGKGPKGTDEPENESYIGKDLWKQLKRVSIPIFSGDVREYCQWKVTYDACVDKAPASKEYKLLQLRQYLSGAALKSIENLGHSAAAYDAAKEKLDRKYGGPRRQIAVKLEELETFRDIREDRPSDLECFSDLLDVAVINLKEANRQEELRNGSFYNKLLKKLPETMIINYQRWLSEQTLDESVESLKNWINKESQYYTVAHEVVKGFKKEPRESNAYRKPKIRSFVTEEKIYNSDYRPSQARRSVARTKCKVCNGDHGVWACEGYVKMNNDSRWDIAKQFRLCFRCLADDHAGRDCPRTRKCGVDGCRENHHRSLHFNRNRNRDRYSKPDRQTEFVLNVKESRPDTQDVTPHGAATEGESKAFTTVSNSQKSKTVNYLNLRTIPVILKTGNRRIKVNALLDDASTKTYINQDIIDELGIIGTPTETTVSVLNGNTKLLNSIEVQIGLESTNGQIDMNIWALTTNRVTGNMKVMDWNESGWPHLKGIQFPTPKSRRPIVDILIGLDYSELHYSLQDIRGNPGEPIARLTPLGWTCIGCVTKNDEPLNYFNHTYFCGTQSDKLETTLRKFWEIEDVSGSSTLFTPEGKKAIDQVQSSLKWTGERYQVSIPWKDPERPKMPNNYKMALQRLKSTENRIKNNPEVAAGYRDSIQHYLEEGYIRKVDIKTDDSTLWYLPHFPVVKSDRATTKTRVVFDASAKFNDMSLNDQIYQGPKLQQDLTEVLWKFRCKPVALVCDIAEMYLRIEIEQKDRPYHRFLWRDLEQGRDPDVYEFSRLVFGGNSSPFLAQYTVRKHAEEKKITLPLASETALKSTYMDDSMDSVDDESQGIQLYKELTDLYQSAGMFARKWMSNSQSVLAEIPESKRAGQLHLDDGPLPSIKTLGVLWSADTDTFSFTAKPIQILENEMTKRQFLSKLSSVFDPMGFLCPYIVRAKIIMQELWAKGLDWDEKLEESLNFRIMRWFSELDDINRIKVPRCLQDNNKRLQTMTLHTFVDASTEAYATVVYGRATYQDGEVSSRFITAKSRVAPLRTVSVPRLEMLGAVLGLQLTIKISRVLEIPITDSVFWSDSVDVLWWLRNQSRTLKPFIGNRVGEIQLHTSPEQWRYVPTKENSADLPTRGLSVIGVAESSLWWSGPEYLTKSKNEWPENLVNKREGPDVELKKSERFVNTSENCDTFFVINSNDIHWIIDPTKFSSWIKLVRVYSWINRFITNCRIDRKEDRVKGELKNEELEDTETYILRLTQIDAFPAEYKSLTKNGQIAVTSKLASLKPIIDEEGLIRCDGRLKYADHLPFDTRFPIILPRKHYVTKMIVRHYHEQTMHATGVNQILSDISSKFWILRAREEIKEMLKDCSKCKINNAQCAQQIMAPLPKFRVKTSLRAFSATAVDFAGPFLTKQGRGKVRAKRYMCLFTCLASRAVHIEIAFGLDTDSFLNAFYRFVNRRGLPQELSSDNGSNFVGADKELRELVSQLDQSKISQKTVHQGVKWYFNPPSAPHFGGVHEIMIKAAKRAVKAILGNADITDEELMTAFTGAENLINSRPLTYISASPEDDAPLTPNHFLFGQVGGRFAPESVDDTEFNIRKRWRRVQELVKHFWKRWLKEWVPGLNVRKKWHKIHRDLDVGDVVLVVSPDTPRGQWPIGRITETFKSKDGHVRVVNVKYANKILKRPIHKLCPLDVV